VAHAIIDRADLRELVHVFADRAAAGRALAELLASLSVRAPLVLAVPAGGVPVAAEICRRHGWPLDFAVVSKITPAWNSEVGYGAVAFDGSARIDEHLVAQLGVPLDEIAAGTARARAKVERRLRALRGGRPAPELRGRTVILVDDGVASGTTARVAINALRQQCPERLVLAVPTAHQQAAETLARVVDVLVCANLRSGPGFAVADAYAEWHDVSEPELARVVASLSSEPVVL